MTSDGFCYEATCNGDYIVIEDQGGGGNPDRQIGLCILLMDASGSMQTTKPFEDKGNNSSLIDLVSRNVARAIFDLKNLTQGKAKDAYILALMFDDVVKELFFDSVDNLTTKHHSEGNFENFIKQELSNMGGGTDITTALEKAYTFYEQFIHNKINSLGEYTVLSQLDRGFNNNPINISNVRVLIYTDGNHNANSTLYSPFKDLDPDILMGAYFGEATDAGARELRNILGNCFKHNEKQFFLINNTEDYAQLKNLFRMASGASGFCPICLTNIKRG